MRDKRYNGWTNYETWCVHLWQTNDEDSDTAIREVVAETLKNDEDALSWGVLATVLKAYVEALMPDSMADNPDMWYDLATAALSEVNWQELAENLAEVVESEVSP